MWIHADYWSDVQPLKGWFKAQLFWGYTIARILPTSHSMALKSMRAVHEIGWWGRRAGYALKSMCALYHSSIVEWCWVTIMSFAAKKGIGCPLFCPCFCTTEKLLWDYKRLHWSVQCPVTGLDSYGGLLPTAPRRKLGSCVCETPNCHYLRWKWSNRYITMQCVSLPSIWPIRWQTFWSHFGLSSSACHNSKRIHGMLSVLDMS